MRAGGCVGSKKVQELLKAIADLNCAFNPYKNFIWNFKSEINISLLNYFNSIWEINVNVSFHMWMKHVNVTFHIWNTCSVYQVFTCEILNQLLTRVVQVFHMEDPISHSKWKFDRWKSSNSLCFSHVKCYVSFLEDGVSLRKLASAYQSALQSSCY